MSDKAKSGLPDPTNRTALKRWLKQKPQPLAVCFAARMAHLALPLLGELNKDGFHSTWGPALVLATFRANLISPLVTTAGVKNVYVAARLANKEASAIATANRIHPSSGATFVAADAVYAADAEDRSAHAGPGRGAYALYQATIKEGDYIRLQISNALTELEEAEGRKDSFVWYSRRAAWRDGELPGPFGEKWAALRNVLPESENWRVWLDWAEARFRGEPDWPDKVNNELLKWRKEWDRTPAEVNADILKLLRKEGWYTDGNPSPPTPNPSNESAEHNIDPQADQFDLFLSYSNVDLAAATWIDDVLRRAGYRVFLQPRDMPPGSNFVTEMNRGLERSARLIALLSPDYESSKHCQAEWASAYAEDGDGAKKKLIPILLRGRVSKPLAKQIVYVSLAGLSQDDQVAAILRAVGYQGPAIAVNAPAPGLAGVAALKERIDSGYAVALSPDQKLTRSPAALADTSSLGSTPEELIQYIRQIAQRLVTDCAALAKKKSNISVPQELEARIDELKSHFERANAALEPLALQDRVRAAHRQLANSLKSGDLPNGGNWRDHRSDLREALDLLPQIFPGLAKHKMFRARKAFERMEPDERAALKEWGRIVESSPEASAVLDTDLKEDVADAVKRAEAGNEIVRTDNSDEVIEIASDTNREMASKSLIVSDWLSTPREMLQRAGKTAEEIERTAKPFDKLYERAKGPLGKLIEYFMQWL